MLFQHLGMRGMRAFLRMLPLTALFFFFLPSAHAATNPAGFVYRDQNFTATDLANISAFGESTGLLITGRCNRNHPAFAEARSHGAEVLVYLSITDIPDVTACQTDYDFYYPGGVQAAVWPFPGDRRNFNSWKVLDLTEGSSWSDHVVAYVEALMTNPNIDGVFLDVVGARLWSDESDWDTWPTAEKNAWTDGNVDIVRRLDASRRAIKPRFIIVNNNLWDRRDNYADAFLGEQYVDGVTAEHHEWASGGFHANYLARPFSNLGHRRVIAIAKNATDAANWRTATGVTHVSSQFTGSSYAVPPAPAASEFHRLTDRPLTFGRTSVAATPSAGMSANQKRGSKFTLSEPATLLSFSAWLDGAGGASGSQAIRMVLYQDASGVPGAKVAESSALNVAAGAAPQWFTFAAPATALSPGNYWIVLHTGATAGIARNRGDGAANWYGNADAFSDLASNPFGSGSTGTVTLSVNVSYTQGN